MHLVLLHSTSGDSQNLLTFDLSASMVIEAMGQWSGEFDSGQNEAHFSSYHDRHVYDNRRNNGEEAVQASLFVVRVKRPKNVTVAVAP